MNTTATNNEHGHINETHREALIQECGEAKGTMIADKLMANPQETALQFIFAGFDKTWSK